MTIDGGPAFPSVLYGAEGQSLRDYFAIRGPEPTATHITTAQAKDKAVNPTNAANKPKWRTVEEIVADLRYAYADTMIARRQVPR